MFVPYLLHRPTRLKIRHRNCFIRGNSTPNQGKPPCGLHPTKPPILTLTSTLLLLTASLTACGNLEEDDPSEWSSSLSEVTPSKADEERERGFSGETTSSNNSDQQAAADDQDDHEEEPSNHEEPPATNQCIQTTYEITNWTGEAYGNTLYTGTSWKMEDCTEIQSSALSITVRCSRGVHCVSGQRQRRPPLPRFKDHPGWPRIGASD